MERRQVFISYAEEDGELARALARELRALGHSSWTYEEDGIGGVSYLVQVHDAIDACETFVLLASATSVRSHQLIREVEHAHESQKVIVPVRVDITQQQFVTSNPILHMASGTNVTLSAERQDAASLAKRIHDTIVFGASRPQTDRGDDASSDVATRGRDSADQPADKQGALSQSAEATLPAFLGANTPDDDTLRVAGTTEVARSEHVPAGTVKSGMWRLLVANARARRVLPLLLACAVVLAMVWVANQNSSPSSARFSDNSPPSAGAPAAEGLERFGVGGSVRKTVDMDILSLSKSERLRYTLQWEGRPGQLSWECKHGQFNELSDYFGDTAVSPFTWEMPFSPGTGRAMVFDADDDLYVVKMGFSSASKYTLILERIDQSGTSLQTLRNVTYQSKVGTDVASDAQRVLLKD